MKRPGMRILTVFLLLTLAGVAGKAVFLCLNTQLYSEFSIEQLLMTAVYGLPMDMSVAGYLSAPLLLIELICVWTRCNGRTHRAADRAGSAWIWIAATLTASAFVADAFLYAHWGFKLDTTPLFYFRSSPSAAMASMTFADKLGAVAAIALCTFIIGYPVSRAWRLGNDGGCPPSNSRKAAATAILLAIGAAMAVAIRGGLTVSTMNPSSAYRTDSKLLNHAAVNPFFSLLYSATHADGDELADFFADNAEASRVLADFDTTVTVPADSAAAVPSLATDRPDIYLVILESFSGSLMPSLGGDPIALVLDSVANNQSVSFTRLYSSSFRTDRALPAILCGFPAQPSGSIMKSTAKMETLPSISRSLRREGYHTAYYYGGDINFTNMRALLATCRFEKVVADNDFPLDRRLSKWGVHDNFLFERESSDAAARASGSGPHFTVIQTSSSHEPFQVPFTGRFEAGSAANAFEYTDRAFGQWLRQKASSPSWSRTIVIATGDHQGGYPATLDSDARRHHVPLVITGGALRLPADSTSLRVDAIASQTDIAATLLAMLAIDTSEFTFSNNILAAAPRRAFISHPSYFGLITPSDTTIVPVAGDDSKATSAPAALAAKAYLQLLYSNIRNR